jgi:hypothetical protein
MRSIRLLTIFVITFGIINSVSGANKDIHSRAEFIRNATPITDGGIFDFYTNYRTIFPHSLNTRHEESGIIYEIKGGSLNLSTKRKGSWSLSAKLKLILSSKRLVVAGLYIEDPIAWKQYTQSMFSQAGEFGLNCQIQISSDNYIFGNPKTKSITKTDAFIRITRDHQTNFIFSEYSIDGREWKFAGSCYLDMSGDEAIYSLYGWSSEEPVHLVASHVAIEPAIPYAIRNMSKYQYRYGDLVHVSLKVKNPGNKTVQIVIDETPPPDWNVVNIEKGGLHQDETIRWSFEMPPGVTHIDYTISPPENSVMMPQFKGKIGASDIINVIKLRNIIV